MKIQKLPEETITKIKSGIIITGATQCVLELIYNSLDAEATCIVVQIDLRNFKIQVTDNGVGILLDDLNHVGERYMTTKFDSYQSNENNFHSYGFKGQALASMLDVCKSLTIKTRCKDSNFTLIKVFQDNKVQPIKKKKMNENETGTSITIEDFMWNMPVRRKRIDEVFDVEEMKSQLKFLAIIHYNVSFTLRNENKSLILLHTERTFNALNTIEQFCGASFCESIKYINHQEKNYKIVGYISMKATSLSSIQLFYVNKRVIARGMIHKIVSDVISKYIRRTNTSLESPIKKNLVLKQIQQPSASFILEIQCPISSYELFTNLGQCTVEFKKWKEVLKCIHKAVKIAFSFNGVNSSSSTASFDKETSKAHRKINRKRGTSALINAVKGIPVNRAGSTKEPIDYNKKPNDGDDVEKFDSSLNKMRTENKRYKLDSPKTENNAITVHQRFNCLTNDSLESPIPKKKVKSCLDSDINFNFHLNFLEQFCDWLKSNKDAFNFLKSFLVCNNSDSNSEILNSKLQNRRSATLEKAACRENINAKNVNHTKDLTKITASNVTKISRLVNSSQKKEISHGKQLNIKLKNKHVSENSDIIVAKEKTTTCFNYFGQNNFNVSRTLKISEKPNYIKICESTGTPSISDIMFNNFLNLRNFSNKIDRSILYQPNSIGRKKFTAAFSNTWKSHYEDSPSRNELRQNRFGDNQNSNELITFENFDSQLEARKYQANTYHFDNFSLISDRTASPRFQNAQIQVNLEEINNLKRVDATVQTYITINENFSKWRTFTNEKKDADSLNSPLFESAVQPDSINCSRESFINDKNKMSEQSLNSNSEDILKANFWISCTLQDTRNTIEMKDVVDLENENLTVSLNSIPKDKLSASSDFICSTQNNNMVLVEQGEVPQENLVRGENSAGNAVKVIFPTNDCCSSEAELLPTIPVEKLSDETLNLNQSNFHVTARFNFVPKGLSPNIVNDTGSVSTHLSPHGKGQIKSTIESSNNELLASVKWQDDFTGQSTKPTLLNGLLDEMRKKAEDKSNYLESEILNASLSYCAIKVHSLLHSFTFTKELLSEVEVIGQLDRKFIVAKITISEPKEMELISLFDQHAVDERIKLENLMNDYVSVDGELISSNLTPKIECKLSKSLVQTITKLEDKLLRFGLTWKLVNETTILVETVPAFLMDKHSKSKSKNYTSIETDIEALINNILEELSETRGAISKIPKKVHNALCLEACRNAIKFNKALSKEEMIVMIEQLTKCKLPFQCAHGRPSVIPIIDLKDFNSIEENSKSVDIRNIKKFVNLQDSINNSHE